MLQKHCGTAWRAFRSQAFTGADLSDWFVLWRLLTAKAIDARTRLRQKKD